MGERVDKVRRGEGRRGKGGGEEGRKGGGEEERGGGEEGSDYTQNHLQLCILRRYRSARADTQPHD